MKKNDIKSIVKKLNIFDEVRLNALSAIIHGLHKIKQLRISSIATALPGEQSSNHKYITRTLHGLNQDHLQDSLLMFSDPKEKLVLMDFTEMERKSAKKTEYVGLLQDGKTRGYGIFTLGEPYKGRSRVLFADVMSSAIINQSAIGKWKIIQNFLSRIIALLKNKVIVADREFCNEEMLQFFFDNDIAYAIRLKLTAGRHVVRLTNVAKKDIDIKLRPGQIKYWKNVYYKGKLWANLAGEWNKKFSEPMYILTSCDPKEGLLMYKKRMKIEESFKDVKDKMGFTKIMNKDIALLIKFLLVGFLAYNILLSLGEIIRKMKLSKKDIPKFSGLHVLFNMIHAYTRANLQKAIRLLESFLVKTRISNMIFTTVFRRS